MADADELAYLDQLYEKAQNQTVPSHERDHAKRRFLDNVFLMWPEISATFEADKHSL